MALDVDVGGLAAPAEEAGAPEIVTPAMARAGAEVIYRALGDVVTYDSWLGRELAEEVFLAMRQAQNGAAF
jgi:hypothetical protein